MKNAQALADGLRKHDFDLISGGTDSHLLLIDIRNKKLLGNTLAEGCDLAGIVFNRNGVPFDPNPPFYPSGIRLGTPGITSRGMKEKDMKKIAQAISDVADTLLKTKTKLGITDEQEKDKTVRAQIMAKTPELKKIHATIKALCRANPVKLSY